MSDPTPNTNPAIPPVSAGPLTGILTRFLRLLGAVRAWAYGHWVRGLIVAATILSMIALTMAGWAYLASVALHSGEITIDDALAALDEGQYEVARNAVGRMLNSGLLARSDYGGPLFVLGAVKMNDAENESAPDRKRIEYLVASRYLMEARAYGLPHDRTTPGLFMLGKSLLESGQFDEGLQTLDELLASQTSGDHPLAWEAQRLLADACLSMPHPKVDKALGHNMVLATNPNLSDSDRTGVALHRAECLTRLGRFDEARQTIATLPAAEAGRADVELMRGKISLDELLAALPRVAPTQRDAPSVEALKEAADAMQHLQKAQQLDEQRTHISRQSSYHLARGFQWQGNIDAALKQFARTRQFHGESFEGLAAALAEADLLREKGDMEGAVLGYRRVLESFNSIPVYRSHVLSLAQIRERLMTALIDFVGGGQFVEALSLIDRFTPLFSHQEQLELRGGTLEQWGNLLVSMSDDEPAASENRKRGQQHLRAAGVAFEQLAEQRYATKFYIADLWRSAENFFRGHNFTRAIRLLDEYLANEPELRNAEALLRLGQAHLALRHVPQSIAAFEECIEFHPLDSATYQARIDCAKAYWQEGNTSRAEQLLRENITGSALKPSSREWKDSLFELGMLLHETGQFEQAIGKLEEAIERYPEDPQRLVSQYVIAESYRRWAQELLGRSNQARTAGERGKSNEQAAQHLNTALKHFEEVQVSITLKTHDIHSDPLLGTMLRNCYMLEGTVLFDLGRYKEAIEAYSNVASLYPDDPFVLETFVQIANCWRRLDQPNNARGAVQQAQIALESLPADADFTSTTALNRDEWRLLLADMSKW